MKFLFLFLDGVGLGDNNVEINPFARAEMPHLQTLLGDQRLVLDLLSASGAGDHLGYAPFESERATLLALDARLGVSGLPQSATGQATVLTGINVPAEVGYHYGPKPNQAVAEFLRNDNLFYTFTQNSRSAALLNAYPPSYFAYIDSGRRMFSAIPLAVTSAGLPLNTITDLNAGRALSADFTAQGWRDRLGLPYTPVLTPEQAGIRLAALAKEYDFTFFEYWLSDYAGHGQDIAAACALLDTFDQVLGGLLQAWDDEEGLILITSDHGNLEDLSTRRHTSNPVPALLIGASAYRQDFSVGLTDLTGIAPAILNFLGVGI